MVFVTVTEALVLHPLLEDQECITESIRILVPVDRMKQKCLQITTIAAVSAPSVACSKLAVQPQKSSVATKQLCLHLTTNGIFIQILPEMYLWTRNNLSNFGSLYPWTPGLDWICLGWGLLTYELWALGKFYQKVFHSVWCSKHRYGWSCWITLQICGHLRVVSPTWNLIYPLHVGSVPKSPSNVFINTSCTYLQWSLHRFTKFYDIHENFTSTHTAKSVVHNTVNI